MSNTPVAAHVVPSHAARGAEPTRIGHHLPGALATLVVVVALVLAPAGTGLLVVVAVAQLAVAATVPLALGLPGGLGIFLVAAGASTAADIAVLRGEPSPGDATTSAGLGSIAGVLALAFVAALVHQLVRRPPRPSVTLSLGGTAVATVVVLALSTLLVLARLTEGPDLVTLAVVTTGAAVVTTHLVDLVLPRPRIVDGVPRGLLGLAGGVAVAVAVAVSLGDGIAADIGGPAAGLVARLGAMILGGVLGAVGVLVSVAISFVLADRRTAGPALAVLAGVAPLAAAAPLAYLLSVLVRGS